MNAIRRLRNAILREIDTFLASFGSRRSDIEKALKCVDILAVDGPTSPLAIARGLKLPGSGFRKAFWHLVRRVDAAWQTALPDIMSGAIPARSIDEIFAEYNKIVAIGTALLGFHVRGTL
jgi:hypothetical protein